MQDSRLPKIVLKEMMERRSQGTLGIEQNWLSIFVRVLNNFGSSLEEVTGIFQGNNYTGMNALLKKVAENLTDMDLERAKVSNSYGYYKAPFISHITPNYALTTWPLYLKRLNAALRNNSSWIPLEKNKKIHLYKYDRCPLCNSGSTYDMYHILIQCQQLNPFRSQSLCSSKMYPIDHFVQFFYNLPLIMLKEIHVLLCIHASQIDLTE